MPAPAAAFRRMVNLNAEDLSVSRRDDTTSSSYGEGLTYSSVGTRRVCIVSTQENEQQTIAGERQAERIVAYADPDVDVQVNDRIDAGSETYEVTAQTAMPRESDPIIYRYDLDDDF